MNLFSDDGGVLQPMAPHKANAHAIAVRPFLITFSGIDGAGKTTQIEHLSSRLQKQGFRVLRLSFWDHVAVWSQMRAGFGGRAEDSCHADGIEGSVAPRNNKHVRKWYLSAARAGFYMLDVVRLRRLLADQHIEHTDVIIFDRYIYDQIANIYSRSFAARLYGRILLKWTPPPDLAFVLDASPTAAFTRKPEYPLEFMVRNRQTFLHLRELAPQLIVIPDAGAEDVRSEIDFHISRSRLAEHTSAGKRPELREASAVVSPQSSCSMRNDPTAIL
jgi:thymidylate kinase